MLIGVCDSYQWNEWIALKKSVFQHIHCLITFTHTHTGTWLYSNKHQIYFLFLNKKKIYYILHENVCVSSTLTNLFYVLNAYENCFPQFNYQVLA